MDKHIRNAQVMVALREADEKLKKIQEKFAITDAEMLTILVSFQGSIVKNMIRNERQGNVDKGAR